MKMVHPLIRSLHHSKTNMKGLDKFSNLILLHFYFISMNKIIERHYLVSSKLTLGLVTIKYSFETSAALRNLTSTP